MYSLSTGVFISDNRYMFVYRCNESSRTVHVQMNAIAGEIRLHWFPVSIDKLIVAVDETRSCLPANLSDAFVELGDISVLTWTNRA